MRPVPILCDDREGRSTVLAELRALKDFTVAVSRLPLGDYLVDDRFLFERKTLPDLARSIASGRLFSQALRLASQDRWRPALVLEGTAADLGGCAMSREALQGALVTVSLFIGLPVLRTRSARETARTFLFAARQGRTVAAGALPRHGTRPKGKRALQSHLLQGLPGIGPERAARLLDHFGSVEAALTADAKALAGVSGIGEQIAEKVRWAVREPGAGYPAARETSATDERRCDLPCPHEVWRGTEADFPALG